MYTKRISRLLNWTWNQMARHRKSRLRHGAFFYLLIVEVLGIISLVFFLTVTVVFLACVLLRVAPEFIVGLTMQVLDFGFCIGFAAGFGATLVIVVELVTLVHDAICDKSQKLDR